MLVRHESTKGQIATLLATPFLSLLPPQPVILGARVRGFQPSDLFA
jgi:hypothetical protein